MRLRILAVGMLATAAVAWAGGDVWKTKPYSQWDEKDIQTVLQTSPWAKLGLQASGAWHPDGTSAADISNLSVAGSGNAGGKASPGGGSVGDTSNRSQGVGGNQPGGAEKLAAAGPQPYSVYWWSARTIREAMLRRAVIKGQMTQDQADKMIAAAPETYQILVSSANMSIFEQRGEAAFKDAAFLQLHKTKDKLTPVSVVLQKGPDGKVQGAIFNFAKKTASGEPTILPDEKEIDFNLRLGDSWLRTNFNPKQMTDGQGEDL
jgi:hypothetical protein